MTQTRDDYMDNPTPSTTNTTRNHPEEAPDSGLIRSTMELLYVWINRDVTGFIQEQGFNFSPNYRFALKVGDDGQHYELECTTNPDYPNVWKNNNIIGLTAIVGENGSGKTSLLSYLLRSNLLPILPEERAEYITLNTERNANNKTVQIYCIDGSICIFHNFPSDELRNHTAYHVININDQDYNQVAESLDKQTRIYITNGFACSSSISESNGYVSRVTFSAEENKALCNVFFKKITAQRMSPTPSSKFLFLQRLLASCKSHVDFEQLVAISYYHYLFSGEIPYSSFVTGNKKLIVNIMNPFSEFQKQYEGIGRVTFHCDDHFTQELSNRINDYVQWISRLVPDFHISPVNKAYLFLIFELRFLSDSLCIPLESLNDSIDSDNTDILFAYVNQLLEKYEDCSDYNESVHRYYLQALEEVKELSEILKDCPTVVNNVPREDLAYKTDLILKLEDNSDSYRQFCNYIDRQMRKETSFVLKYIVIRTPPLSSGELAVQNIFSWLRLPPSYQEIINSDSIPIHDNVLLLLDEVDLYMHPEWQRKFLKLLSDELAAEYPDKQIQVVITTHSPLVLSDIPSGNIIYLEKNEERCTVAERPELKESFGANIFSLLKDSFYLKKSLGEYAHFRIKKVIEDMDKLKRDPGNAVLKETCRSHHQLINIIGEPVIRRKLQTLYNELFDNEPDAPHKQDLAQLIRLLESEDPEEKAKSRALLKEILSLAKDT